VRARPASWPRPEARRRPKSRDHKSTRFAVSGALARHHRQPHGAPDPVLRFAWNVKQPAGSLAGDPPPACRPGNPADRRPGYPQPPAPARTRPRHPAPTSRTHRPAFAATATTAPSRRARDPPPPLPLRPVGERRGDRLVQSEVGRRHRRAEGRCGEREPLRRAEALNSPNTTDRPDEHGQAGRDFGPDPHPRLRPHPARAILDDLWVDVAPELTKIRAQAQETRRTKAARSEKRLSIVDVHLASQDPDS
jgi:hypothetical protein